MAQGPTSRFVADGAVETGRKVVHGSFTLPFATSAQPHEVFAAFSELPLRRRWFRLPGDQRNAHHELDFRVGGGEVARNTSTVSGTVERLAYRSHFLDIVPEKRIVFSYQALVDDRCRWVSLVTIQIAPSGDGTQLSRTEQYAFLILTGDGSDDEAHLRGGTRLQLNGLAAVLEPRGSAG